MMAITPDDLRALVRTHGKAAPLTLGVHARARSWTRSQPSPRQSLSAGSCGLRRQGGELALRQHRDAAAPIARRCRSVDLSSPAMIVTGIFNAAYSSACANAAGTIRAASAARRPDLRRTKRHLLREAGELGRHRPGPKILRSIAGHISRPSIGATVYRTTSPTTGTAGPDSIDRVGARLRIIVSRRQHQAAAPSSGCLQRECDRDRCAPRMAEARWRVEYSARCSALLIRSACGSAVQIVDRGRSLWP